MEWLAIFFFLVQCNALTLPAVNVTSPLSEEEQLTIHLLERCRFLRDTIRPVRKYTDKVHLQLRFLLVKFNGIEETEEIIKITGFLLVQWNLTECFGWADDPNWGHIWRIRPTDFKDMTYQPDFPMWYPIIWQPNGYDNILGVNELVSANNYQTLYIDKKGKAGYEAVGKYVSYCDLAKNLRRFPFDTVTCSLKFQSWSPTIIVTGSNVGFQTAYVDKTSGQEMIVPPDFINSGDVWQLKSVFYTDSIEPHGNHNYSRFEYGFVLKRKSSGYVVNILLPAFSLFILILAAFGLPAHDPERASYSVTVVMNYFLLQGVVDEKLPQSSEPISFSIYLSCLLWLGTASTVYFCVMNKLSTRVSFKSRSYVVLNKYKIGRVPLIDLSAFCLAALCAILINSALLSSMMS